MKATTVLTPGTDSVSSDSMSLAPGLRNPSLKAVTPGLPGGVTGWISICPWRNSPGTKGTKTPKDAAENRTRKILVAGDPFRGYTKPIAAGFHTFGVQSTVLEWEARKKSPHEMIRENLSRKYRRNRYNLAGIANASALERAIVALAPDYVLAMNGATLTDKTREVFDRVGTKSIFWAYDSPIHFPWIAEAAAGFDLIYTYEPEDLAPLSKFGAPRFLPVAHDPSIYFPTDRVTSDTVDLCFVGSLRSYVPQRWRLLRLIADEFKERAIEVWTDRGRWYSPCTFRTAVLSRRMKNLQLRLGAVDHHKINELYNRSRICLNVHNPQSRKAANPRNFEILGSGGFLLTDRSLDDIHGLERGRDYVLYTSENDLLDKIHHFLEHDEERLRIAKSGHSAAKEWHTYACRARTILDDSAKLAKT